MPVYLFQNPETGETVEVIQGMKEKHTFVDDQGVEWKRVFTSPNTAVSDNLIGADTTEAEFVRKTSEKNYTLGDMWDLSARLSEKRAKANGQDPIKEKEKKKYEKHTGKRHPHGKQGGGGKISI